MRIGIDCRLYSQAGIGRYIRNLIYHLQLIDQDNEYYLFLQEEDFVNITVAKNFQKIRANFLWYTLQEQIQLPNLLGKYQLDVLHVPHFNVPFFYQGKIVVTIHDLIHQHFQTQYASTRNPLIYKLKNLGYKKIFEQAVKKSQKIITPSNFVKNQLMQEWQVEAEKITVTHEAVDESLVKLAKLSPDNTFRKMSNNFGIKKPFLFYIGNAHPHKNVETLIKVFLELKSRHSGLSLVLSGKDNFFWQRIKKSFNDENIIFTGFVTDEQSVSLYKNACCFVTASLEEGFGIPVLEAMACSCPVVSSSKGSLVEIGGEAAVYFDPENKTDMVQKISQVIDNKKLKESLIKKGLQRYKIFSWSKLAQDTQRLYLSVGKI